MKLGMRIWVVIVAAGWMAGSAAAQSPVQATLHVSRSEMRIAITRELRLWGTIGGQKVELAASFGNRIGANEFFVLPPGDYPVKLESENKTDRGIERKYDVETSPGKQLTFQLAGLAE